MSPMKTSSQVNHRAVRFGPFYIRSIIISGVQLSQKLADIDFKQIQGAPISLQLCSVSKNTVLCLNQVPNPFFSWHKSSNPQRSALGPHSWPIDMKNGYNQCCGSN